MTFHNEFPEKTNLNQYWYSAHTIEVILNEISALACGKVAFLSTPSLFYSAIAKGVKSVYLLDIDENFADTNGDRFIKFDYQEWNKLPESLHNTFSLAVFDPPFVTSEVLACYAGACKLLLKQNGRIMVSSLSENCVVLKAQLGRHMSPVPFKPAIPNLVYQYSLFVNYPLAVDSGLRTANKELKNETG